VDRQQELIRRLLEGRSDADIRFGELRWLLLRLGFSERVRGSHHVFSRPGLSTRINLQRAGGQAKAYQVRQVRAMLWKHRLLGDL
jgi:hypothetical protein